MSRVTKRSKQKEKNMARQNVVINRLMGLAAGALASAYPEASPAILGITTAYQMSFDLLRLKGQEELKEMFTKIVAKVDADKLQDSEHFSADLNSLIANYFQEADENRRKYLRNIFVNHTSVPTNNLNRFLNMTRQLGEREMLILSLFDGPLDKILQEKIKVTKKAANVTQIKLALGPNSKITEIEILESCNNLLMQGIFRYPPSTAGTFAGTFRNDHFILTYIGIEYIDYVKA